MFANIRKSKNRRFSAGLYWRTKTGMRFWGWGKPAAGMAEDSERPLSNLAEWLRMAHSAIASTAAASKDVVRSGSAPSGDSPQQELISPAIGTLAGV